MFRKTLILYLLCFLVTPLSFAGGPFIIGINGKTVPMLISSADYPGVIRAFHDLQTDIGKVSGTKPSLFFDTIPGSSTVILAGTLESPLISGLIKRGLFHPEIKGKWESFQIETILNPYPGIESALVIAGSDKRGTIYGIYEISRKIGVSPWYWWADVVPEHRDTLVFPAGNFIQGPPSVKYRGIFLNDEAPDLSNWVYAKFGTAPVSKDPPVPAGIANYNHEFYARIFELLLRLRGNYLWPAMWNNAFNEDDTLNARMADEYGIVMGTSHQEPMLRAQKEWDRRYKSTLGSWNFVKHEETLENFWREGIRRNKPYESIVTLGLRGADDTEMAPGGPEANKALLEHIVDIQRQMLREEIDTNITLIPQVWCLYKEVLDYYKAGMRVPDDVTLLWAEDNWGNIRRLPTQEERKRSGGAGIYYHFDYHGGPRSYQWLNTSPLPKIWDQMSLAREYGADRVWIVNAGHFRGYELPVSFFIDLGWYADSLKADNLQAYTEKWAEEQFGTGFGAEAGRILSAYSKFNGRRKPELLRPETYSIVTYQEADRVVTEFRQLQHDAEALYEKMPAGKKDAFYHLVLFPVKACAIVNELYVTAAKNDLFARQRRASANDMADRVQDLFSADTSLMAHYNKVFASGKWDHFMDQSHLGYTTWRDPPANSLDALNLTRIPVSDPSKMGVSVEGSENAWPGSKDEARLPGFDNINDQVHYLEIFKTGRQPVQVKITAPDKWITIKTGKATIDKDTRIPVAINWKKFPGNQSRGSIHITSGDISVKVDVMAEKHMIPEGIMAFVENDGYVSMESDHFMKNTDARAGKWIPIENYGHTGSAMRAEMDPGLESPPVDQLPCLEYPVYVFNSGEVYVDPVFAPSLNFIPGRPVRYAISFDDEQPQMITLVAPDFDAKNGNRAWEQSVSDNSRKGHSVHVLAKPGYHILKIRAADPGIVLQKIVINTGGLRPSYLGPPESLYRGKKL